MMRWLITVTVISLCLVVQRGEFLEAKAVTKGHRRGKGLAY